MPSFLQKRSSADLHHSGCKNPRDAFLAPDSNSNLFASNLMLYKDLTGKKSAQKFLRRLDFFSLLELPAEMLYSFSVCNGNVSFSKMK